MRKLEKFNDLIPLREFCRNNDWPRLPQWQHWITRRHPIAIHCIKKIGNRYLVNVKALEEYLSKVTIDG